LPNLNKSGKEPPMKIVVLTPALTSILTFSLAAVAQSTTSPA
jgi:hypothetical protein